MWPQAMYKKKVSYRSPERVAAEIRYCVETFNYQSIFFDDDTFNVGTERVSMLCDELKKIGLPWTMMGRLDCSPTWLYDKMVDAGCVGMRFGIETFNLDVLRNINKGIERVDFQGILEHIARKYPKLMLHVTMMKDLPEQTQEIHERDMAILKDMEFSTNNKYRSYQLASCAPFPGTALHQMLLQESLTTDLDDFKSYDGGQDTVMKTLKNHRGNT